MSTTEAERLRELVAFLDFQRRRLNALIVAAKLERIMRQVRREP